MAGNFSCSYVYLQTHSEITHESKCEITYLLTRESNEDSKSDQSLCCSHEETIQITSQWRFWSDNANVYILFVFVLYYFALNYIVLYVIVLYFLYCIVMYSVTFHYIVLHCIVLYCIVLHCIPSHYIMLYWFVFHCNNALYSTQVAYKTWFYWIILYCIALHCIALCCTKLNWMGLNLNDLYCTVLRCSVV